MTVETDLNHKKLLEKLKKGYGELFSGDVEKGKRTLGVCIAMVEMAVVFERSREDVQRGVK